MSIRLQRFDFGSLRDFRGPLVVPAVAEETVEEAPPPPPPPTFSEDELEATRAMAKNIGYAEGYDAGLAHAAEQANEKQLAAQRTIANLSHHISELPARYQALLESEAKQLTDLVLLISQKVSGTILDTNAAEAVASLVTSCLPIILSKPLLVIELHPAAFDQTMDSIESLLQTSGFEGQVQFRSNTSIGEYDAILDWGAGQATRNTAELWKEIERLLASTPVTISPIITTTMHQNGSEAITPTTPPTA